MYPSCSQAYLPTFNKRCALSPTGSYSGQTHYDYPSEQDVITVLRNKTIVPIFAVTSDVTSSYEGLKQNIPNAAIGVLSSNSANVVDLLVAQYNKIKQTTRLERVGLDDRTLNIRYFSACNGATLQETNVCNALGYQGSVSFRISINLQDCRKGGGTKSVRIAPQGLPTAFQVAFNAICEESWG